jgi:hypothetical protein
MSASPVKVEVGKQASESARIARRQVVGHDIEDRNDVVIAWATFKDSATFVMGIPAPRWVFAETLRAAHILLDLPWPEALDFQACQLVVCPAGQSRDR